MIAVAVALAVTLPFVIADPDRALAGMLAPLAAPIVSDGVGAVQFGVTDRYTPLFPRVAYTVASAGSFLALLAVAWLRRRDLASAPLVWPFLPLYVSWRSLQNYFAFVPLFALVADDELRATPPTPPGSSRSSSAPELHDPRTAPRSPS